VDNRQGSHQRDKTARASRLNLARRVKAAGRPAMVRNAAARGMEDKPPPEAAMSAEATAAARGILIGF